MSSSEERNPRSGSKVPSTGSGNEIGLDELMRAQYTFGVPGQATRYNKTTKVIAEYARIAYGKEMWKLVYLKEETSFDDPEDPGDDASRVAMERYKMLLRRNLDDEKKYKQNKAKVFGIIMGRCHAAMRNKIESLPDYEQMEQDDDVIELLKKMKELAYSTDNNQYEYWVMQATMRKMITMKQEAKESLVGFGKRFLAQYEVTQEVWGELIPHKMKGKKTEEQETAGKRFLACLFLAGVDRDRYKTAINDLNNDFVQGTVSYPDDVPAMLALLSNRREEGKSFQKYHEMRDGVGLETSFVQVDRRRCYVCKKRGHIARVCPNRDDEKDSDDESNQVGSQNAQVSSQREVKWSGMQWSG